MVPMGDVSAQLDGSAAWVLIIVILSVFLFSFLVVVKALVDILWRPRAPWAGIRHKRALWASLVIAPLATGVVFFSPLIILSVFFSLFYLVVIRRKLKKVVWTPASAVPQALQDDGPASAGWYPDPGTKLPYAVAYWSAGGWSDRRWWNGRRWKGTAAWDAGLFRLRGAHPLLFSTLLGSSIPVGLVMGDTIFAVFGHPTAGYHFGRQLLGSVLGGFLAMPFIVAIRWRQDSRPLPPPASSPAIPH